MKALLLVLSILLPLGASPAAAAFNFGTDETLHRLVDVEVVGENGEALALGYKTSTQNFLLPYAISDDGYILIVKAEPGKYYGLPADQLAQWQAAGLIPDPLPPYEISLLDRVFGYALWPTLAIIALVYLVPMLRKRKAVAAAAAAPTEEKSS